MHPRPAHDLADVDDPAWPDVLAAVRASAVPVRVLDVTPEDGLRTLHRLQVTARSVLGALALRCGGLVLDHGWLRVLGGGGDGLVSLADANGIGEPPAGDAPPPHLVVALDAVGGVFAVDGGGLGVKPGGVCYRGPDTLRWQGLGAGHAAFVHAALDGALGDDVAGALRWEGWRAEVEVLPLDQGLHLWPPPFSAQGADVGSVSRRPVPYGELASCYADLADQVAGLPDGASFELRTAD